jgi:phage-related minor tail protein
MNEFSAAVDRLVKAGLITRDIATSRMAEKLEDVLGEVEVTGKRNIIEANREPIDRMTEFAKQAAQSIQSSFADFLFDPFQNGLKGMLSGFLTVIRRMLAEVAASAILKSVFGPYQGKGGFPGAVADALLTRASGGPVSAGTPYLVGERGPELFVPGTSGGIMPNNRLANMGGGGVTVAPVYNIDARGATADLQKALPGILQENNRRIFDELDRRYGIGR